MQFYLTNLILLISVNFCIDQQPADKKANAKTKATLDLIVGLPKRGKFLYGQFVGWSKVTFNTTRIIEIDKLTGHVPVILGCDYAARWTVATPPQSDIDYSSNTHLKKHSNRKGLVTIETHFPNPVSPNGGGVKNRSGLVFTDLLKPKTETGKRWRSYLDIVAEGLNDLQQANATVLYRPFHGMNERWL